MNARYASTVLGLACVSVVVASMALADENAGATTGIPTPRLLVPVAQEPTELDYMVVRQDAAAMFAVLAGDMKLRLDLSDKVHGTFSDIRLSGTPDEIMEVAADEVGIDWFAFNGALYVSSTSEALTRIVRLGELQEDKVMSVLRDSGLPIDKLDVKPAAQGNALALSGPPKLLALAEALIEGIPPAPKERVAEAAEKIVTIRRGIDTEKVRLP